MGVSYKSRITDNDNLRQLSVHVKGVFAVLRIIEELKNTCQDMYSTVQYCTHSLCYKNYTWKHDDYMYE